MLAIKIWNYIRGYVIIRVEGLTLERLLNLAASYNIYIWDIKRHNNIILEMKSTTQGFKAMKKIVKKVGCRISIVEKIGIPFTILKFRNRKMLATGFLVFLISIFLLTSTIWKIEIKGNSQTPSEEIIALLKSNNIGVGKLKYTIDKEKIKKVLINQYDYISFIAPTIKGTKITIELKEEDLPPEKVNKAYPCNIVAKKKGLIIKVIPKNGNSKVEKGQLVEEGQLLITGILKNQTTDTELYVHSEGEVQAITRYSQTISEPIIKVEEKLTGEIHTQKGIEIMDRGIKFTKGDILFKEYREEIIEKDLINIPNLNIDLPIRIVEYRYKELETREVKQNIDFLKKSLALKATQIINEELSEGAQIKSKNIINDIEDNILTVHVVIEVIEDIGKKQILENFTEIKEE